jgi:hypothetical protein
MCVWYVCVQCDRYLASRSLAHTKRIHRTPCTSDRCHGRWHASAVQTWATLVVCVLFGRRSPRIATICCCEICCLGGCRDGGDRVGGQSCGHGRVDGTDQCELPRVRRRLPFAGVCDKTLSCHSLPLFFPLSYILFYTLSLSCAFLTGQIIVQWHARIKILVFIVFSYKKHRFTKTFFCCLLL